MFEGVFILAKLNVYFFNLVKIFWETLRNLILAKIELLLNLIVDFGSKDNYFEILCKLSCVVSKINRSQEDLLDAVPPTSPKPSSPSVLSDATDDTVIENGSAVTSTVRNAIRSPLLVGTAVDSASVASFTLGTVSGSRASSVAGTPRIMKKSGNEFFFGKGCVGV